MKDRKGRGTIFEHIVAFLKQNRPKTFILENVVGLVEQNGGAVFQRVLDSLHKLGNYNVSHG